MSAGLEDLKEILKTELKTLEDDSLELNYTISKTPVAHYVLTLPRDQAVDLIEKAEIFVGFNKCTIKRHIVLTRSLSA